MPSNDVRRNLLSKASIESFSDALWLGIRPFLCFTLQFIESHGDAFKRCAAQFAFQSFDRELLGRLVARYSAVFVFYIAHVVESHADAFKRCTTQFAFQRSDRELLGCRVARWPFLCFTLQFIESHGDAFKRCAAQFAFQSFDRELLGRLVARYSAVFVFYFTIHRITR